MNRAGLGPNVEGGNWLALRRGPDLVPRRRKGYQRNPETSG